MFNFQRTRVIISQELSCIYKAFSDFRLVAQIREEIEKVNQIGLLVPSIA